MNSKQDSKHSNFTTYLINLKNNSKLILYLMKRLYWTIIIWTVVYWILVAIGITLFGLTMGSVSIDKYALKRNSFTSTIDPSYFIPGMYDKGIATYFVQFPIAKQTIVDISINTTNSDLQGINVVYSFTYRINPNNIYTLYTQMGTDYEKRLISILNSIISENFMATSQANSRVSLQSTIIQSVKTSNKFAIFQNAITIQALFINEINFMNNEEYYEKAYQDTTSYSQTYVNTQLQLQKTKIDIQAMKGSITSTEQNFLKNLNQKQASKYISSQKENLQQYQTSQITVQRLYNVSRMFSYYKPTQFVLE